MMTQADEFLSNLRGQRIYKLGASPLVWGTIRQLNIEGIIDGRCPGEQEVSTGRAALAILMTRLLKPKALYKIEEWLGETGLNEMLGHPAERFNDDRLGRMLDQVAEHTDPLWVEVMGQALARYPGLAGRFIHYDVTSCYFEGEYAQSELAQRGYSRDHRPDAKQVNLGVSVVGESGLPLLYELLAGNQADCKTPPGHLAKLGELFDRIGYRQQTVMVVDRAMLNRPLVAAYIAQEVQFLGPWMPAEVQAWVESVPHEELMAQPLSFQPQSAHPDAPPTYYGVLREMACELDDSTATLRVLALYSRGKARLDRQLRENHQAQVLSGLADIHSKLNQRRYKRAEYVRQRIKRLFDKARVARGLVNWTLSGEDGALSLVFEADQAAIAAAARLDGRYALVTNADLSADEMLTHFKAQHRVEQRFSIVKGPVPLRPIHLRNDRRIRALVFLTMLALLIYTIIEWLVRRATPRRRRPWTARAIFERFEEFSVSAQLFADGSMAWLPPPLSQDQHTIWQALQLPKLPSFLAQAFA